MSLTNYVAQSGHDWIYVLEDLTNNDFTVSELRSNNEGERLRGHEPWTSDPYGVGAVLGAKRTTRNWVEESLRELCDIPGLPDAVKRLLVYKGSDRFPESLPWEDASM